MGMKSRRKGKTGELELCRVLADNGFPARRGVQYQGGPDSPDIVCDALPGIHWESKRTERLDLYGALMQASSECRLGQVPVVAHRRNDSAWVAILRLDEFLDILRHSDFAVPTVQDAADLVCGPGARIEGIE